MLAFGTVPFESAPAASVASEGSALAVPVEVCLYRVQEVRRRGWSAGNENGAAWS